MTHTPTGQTRQIFDAICSRWDEAQESLDIGALGDIDCLSDDTGYRDDIVDDEVGDMIMGGAVVQLPGHVYAPTPIGYVQWKRAANA